MSSTCAVVFVDRHGERRHGAIRLGVPYQLDDREARCPVAIEGLYPSLADIPGTDTLQALLLAGQLVERLLTAFLEEGGRILLATAAGEEEDFPLESYFGRSP